VEDIDFKVDFIAENSNKLRKFGFGSKNQLSLNFFIKKSILKMQKIKNVFTLGPRA
jgi:hypothetical protein